MLGVVRQEPIISLIMISGLAYLGFNYLAAKQTKWRAPCVVLVLGLPLTISGYYLISALRTHAGVVEIRRGFYGSFAVVDHLQTNAAANARFMSHGTTTHGIQLLNPDSRSYPTSYYVPESGIGRALSRSNQKPNRNIGVIGLGVGTIASYGMDGDNVRFFEIDQNVIDLAESYFDFIGRTDASIEIVLGDGRLMLQEEVKSAVSKYDLLVVDAFSGDAVPVHLLTQEAFPIYLERLKPSGVLVINISNRIIDLRQAIEGNARQFELSLAHIIHYREATRWWGFSSQWLLLAPRRDTLDDPAITKWTEIIAPTDLEGSIWTDEFASILPMLR